MPLICNLKLSLSLSLLWRQTYAIKKMSIVSLSLSLSLLWHQTYAIKMSIVSLSLSLSLSLVTPDLHH